MSETEPKAETPVWVWYIIVAIVGAALWINPLFKSDPQGGCPEGMVEDSYHDGWRVVHDCVDE